MKHHFISIALCTLIIGSGVLLAVGYTRYHQGAANVADALVAAPIAQIEIDVLQPVELPDELILTGRIVPWVEITLSAEIRGKIEVQNVEAGHGVTTGQELYRIDTTSLQTTHDQAKARFDLAVQEMERIRDLGKNGISSPQALDRARTDRDVAQADLSAANDSLEKSIVRSPGDGVVQTLYKRQTEFVDVGTDLVHLAHVARMRAAVGVPERDIAHFSEGDSVEVYVEALGDTPRVGNIVSIGASADLATRTFLVEIELDNERGQLRSGMTVRAHFVREVYEDAVVAPLFSILSLENQRFVMIEKDHKAEMRPVRLGRILGERVHVTEGLSPGDHLIIKGHRNLRDGAPVQIQE